jgi:Leucine-rich repeat (LRR) protein
LKFFVHCPSTIKVLTIDYNQLASLAFTGGDNLSILSVSHNAITKIGVVLPNILFLDGESNQIEDL